MNKIMHKNQVIITALAIMIAIAGYLNFSEDGDLASFTGDVYEATSSTIQEEDNLGDTESLNNNEASQVNESLEETTLSEEEYDITSEVENVVSADEEYESSEEVETVAENDSDNIGDAVLVSSTINMNYFYTVKLSREQTRAKNKEELMGIVESTSVTEEQKQSAINEIIELTDRTERENEAEILLSARGFENSVVSIGDNGVDVVVDAQTVTEEQIAQISDIVSRKTGIGLEKIVITPVNATE